MVKPVCPVDGALMPFTVEDVAFHLGANQDFLGASAGLFISGFNIMRFMIDLALLILCFRQSQRL